jgi:cell division protein FtsB
MTDRLRVDTDTSLFRDMSNGAIVNSNKREYDKFMELSKRKLKEKQEMDKLKDEVKDMKSDIQEIKSLLLSIAKNDL